MPLNVHIVDMRHVQDNYNYILHDDETGMTAVVDPSEAKGIVEFLDEKGWSLDVIFNTHHHWDHVNGNLKLKAHYGAEIIGFAGDKHRIPGIDRMVEEGERILFASHPMHIIRADGHTIGHILYHFTEAKLLFTGDTLFSMGCGRMFEGDAKSYHQSLMKIAALSDETQIYCAHEYTIPNGRFAKYVEPQNQRITERLEQARALLRAGKPTLPVSLGIEKKTNPFLRTNSSEIRQSLALEETEAYLVFARLRQMKDEFRAA